MEILAAKRNPTGDQAVKTHLVPAKVNKKPPKNLKPVEVLASQRWLEEFGKQGRAAGAGVGISAQLTQNPAPKNSTAREKKLHYLCHSARKERRKRGGDLSPPERAAPCGSLTQI